MRNLEDVFDSWPTLAAMAADVGRKQDAVEKWRKRKSIPVDAWPALLAALKRKGKELTGDRLLLMHERARRSASAGRCS